MMPPSKEPQITVLVSIEPESSPLRDLQQDACAALQDLEIEIVYLVSDSAEAQLAETLALHEEHPESVRVLTFSDTIGPASRLAAGLEAARGEWVLTLPGEFDTDLSEFPSLLRALEGGADLVIASRSNWHDAAPRLQSRLFSRLVSRATGGNLADVTSRTRLLRREIASELAIYGEFHRYLPMLAQRAGFRVCEVPIRQHKRARAATVYSPATYLWRTLDLLSLFFLSRFTRHPLRLFGGVGAALGTVGAAILAVTAFQRVFFDVGLADRPVLVLGTLLVGLGVQVFTIGLLGELILFVRGRSVRDYRVAHVYGAAVPPLEPRDTLPEGDRDTPDADTDR